MVNKVINLRLPVFLYDALKKEAEMQGKSQSAVFRDAVERGVSLHENEKVSEEFVYTCVRVSDDLHDKMREISKSEFSTVTGISSQFVRDYISEKEQCAVDQSAEKGD